MSGAHDGDGPGGAEHRRAEAARLREELLALGRSLDRPDGAADSESMVERVLGRILVEQLPVAGPRGAGERWRAVRRWARARWRSLVAVVCGLLTVLVLTPPVRAAVPDWSDWFGWFGFAGVEVRHDPSAVPSPGAGAPGCGLSVPLGEAERRAGFAPRVPKALGPPDAVAVSGLPRGRLLVTLCWREEGRTVRLDQFPARLDPAFAKTVREQPEWLSLGGDGGAGGVPEPALWFARPHLLSLWLVDADGHRFAREERTAGPTLLWTDGGPAGEGGVDEVTLRLEGVASKARALEIAGSVEEAGG
ncbi:hypothetical protein GCM10019016_059150 [Streptomyces prasinosporus]|uniref:Uncharacterized protein n=1 Tax=Streptomyces prasinosporus TaxID=68256 RepID=A0ABP6TUP5_9ACTN